MISKDRNWIENIASLILLGIVVSSGIALALFLFLSPTTY
jgi:hypothetical protein